MARASKGRQAARPTCRAVRHGTLGPALKRMGIRPGIARSSTKTRVRQLYDAAALDERGAQACQAAAPCYRRLGRVLNWGFRGGVISASGAVSDEELTDATLRRAG